MFTLGYPLVTLHSYGEWSGQKLIYNRNMQSFLATCSKHDNKAWIKIGMQHLGLASENCFSFERYKHFVGSMLNLGGARTHNGMQNQSLS